MVLYCIRMTSPLMQKSDQPLASSNSDEESQITEEFANRRGGVDEVRITEGGNHSPRPRKMIRRADFTSQDRLPPIRIELEEGGRVPVIYYRTPNQPASGFAGEPAA
jgi:hypothetical protein